LATLESASKANFVYAFPYLDTFKVKLTVRDSSLNEDSKIETYVVDECPVCIGGGGGPSIPTMVENHQAPPGKISVTGIEATDIEYCPVVKARIISKEDL
jgi:hypothetical protein